MKYRVHIYATYRDVVRVEAENHDQAMRKAVEKWRPSGHDCDAFEFADEITGYLVDEVGDDEYERSRAYDGNFQPGNDSPAEQQRRLEQIQAVMRRITAQRTDRTDYEVTESLGAALDEINGILGLPLTMATESAA
jgi:hypothetical protein